MTRLVSALPWQSSPDYQAPVAIVDVDLTLDTTWQFNLQSFFDQWNTAPAYIVIDNLTNQQTVTLSFGPGYAMPVNQFSRLTVPVPNGAAQCIVTGVPGANPVRLIFAIKNLGIADTSNLFAIQQATAAGAALEVITNYFGSQAISTQALNHIEQFIIVAPATAQLPDPAADPNATPNGWNLQIWNADASTDLLTIAADNGKTIDGLASLDLSPGQKVRLVTDGANYFTEIQNLRKIDIVGGSFTILPSAEGTTFFITDGVVAMGITLPGPAEVTAGWKCRFVAIEPQTISCQFIAPVGIQLLSKGVTGLSLNFYDNLYVGCAGSFTYDGAGIYVWQGIRSVSTNLAIIAGNVQFFNTTSGGEGNRRADMLRHRFVCTAASNGYAVGEEVEIWYSGLNVGSGWAANDLPSGPATSRIANSTIHIANGTTGVIAAIVPANFDWFLNATYFN